MDTKAIEAFLKIYEIGNLHKAADSFYISQQGLSRTLRSLEKELGCTLFERTTYGLLPTAAGKRFYQSALAIHEELKDLNRDLKIMTDQSSPLRLACSYGTMHFQYSLIRNFQKKNPDIPIEWREYTDLETDRLLLDQRADLAYVTELKEAHQLEAFPVFQVPCSALIYDGHPYFEKTQLKLQDLQDEPVLIEGKEFHIYQKFLRCCQALGFQPEIAAETTEINLCINLCSQGEGIAIVPNFIAESCHLPNLRAVPLMDEEFCFRGYLAKLKHVPLSLSAKNYWNYVKSHLD